MEHIKTSFSIKGHNVNKFVFNLLFNLMCVVGFFVKSKGGDYSLAIFGIDDALAAIIITAITTTAAGVASNRAKKRSEEKSLELAGIAREDTLKQQATQTGLQKRQLALQESKSNYEKMVGREVANKTTIANLGASLNHLTKSGVDMNSFINMLYGNTVKRMG